MYDLSFPSYKGHSYHIYFNGVPTQAPNLVVNSLFMDSALLLAGLPSYTPAYIPDNSHNIHMYLKDFWIRISCLKLFQHDINPISFI